MARASSTKCCFFGNMNVFLEGEEYFLLVCPGNSLSKCMSYLVSLVYIYIQGATAVTVDLFLSTSK